jgi:hypothetical protein
MLSKQEAKRMAATAFVSVAVTLGGVFAYGPASNAGRTPVDVGSGIADSATFGPWIENLSATAVDAGGIEADLDGNASALFASDYLP